MARGQHKYSSVTIVPQDAPLLEKIPAPYVNAMRATGTLVEKAEALGVPTGTVRSRIHRGRALLAKLREERDEANRSTATEGHYLQG